MQLNGVGVNHSANMHQVTACTHNHAQSAKVGGGPAPSGVGADVQAVQTEPQTEGQFSLSAWLEKTLGSGKRALQSIWGSNETGVPGDADKNVPGLAQGQESGAAAGVSADAAGQGGHQPDMPQMMHTPQIAAAATAVPELQPSQNTPYFSAVEDTGRQQETLWQKVKVKFNEITGQLSGHLPRKFFSFQAKSSFEEKQERPKEQLRKKNKYRRDTVELGSVRTDDNYLLDSYDRTGGYSKLSTKK